MGMLSFLKGSEKKVEVHQEVINSALKETSRERLIHLKIKLINLADEAKTNRKEASKTTGMAKWRLNDHRTSVIRTYARSNHLAYGYLRGVPYEKMEKKCYLIPNWKEITKIAKNFGGPDFNEEQLNIWIKNAQEYASSNH